MLESTYTFTTVETHTVGEPTRIITSGFPMIPTGTMMEKKQFLETHYDALRSALMCEPRGHQDMVGALIVDSVHDEADFGVIFMDAQRWVTMCGHATIGCATFAVETHRVPVCEPYTDVMIDTPVGMVSTKVRVEHNKAIEVTIQNIPSFLYEESIHVCIQHHNIDVSIAFGGTFFALVDANQLGITLEASDIKQLIPLTKQLLNELNKKVHVKHPTLDIERVVNVEYYVATSEKSQRSIVIAEEGQVDRSPCGTGTSAKLAYLYATNVLRANEIYTNESFTGVTFKGMFRETTMVGEFVAIQPYITGSAYIIGSATYVIDETDPLTYGFQLPII